MKIISDSNIMMAIKSTNKKLFYVRLSTYDDNETFSRKLISTKFSDAKMLLKYGFCSSAF